MTGKDIHHYARSILGRRAEVVARMWRARPGSFAEAMQGGLRVGQFNVERILKAFLPDAIPEDFAELQDTAEGDGDGFFRPQACRDRRRRPAIRRLLPRRPFPPCSGR